MAGYPLIDEYLQGLRVRLKWHRNVDKVVAEVEDHLTSAVDSLERSGMDTESAQQETLRRFGDPRLFALELATNSKGRLAVPTRFTKNTGVVAMIAALFWLGAVVSWWVTAFVAIPLGVHMQWTASTPGYGAYQAGSGMLTIALILLVVVMAGLHRRHGGLGSVGWTGMVVALLAVNVVMTGTQPSAMPFQAWGTLVVMATFLFALAMYRRDLVPRWDVVVFGVGGLLGAVVWGTLRILAGSYREWGSLLAQHWTINLSGVTIGVVVLAIGLFRIGIWLRREQPADLLGLHHARLRPRPPEDLGHLANT